MKKLALLIFLLCASPVWGSNPHYVNPGNTSSHCDTNNVSEGSNCDGSTHAKGFRYIENINAHSFITGDDVYFLYSGTWLLRSSSGYLDIDWSGTSEDPVTIGTYYMNGDTPTVTTPGPTGNMPTLDGNNIYPSWGSYNGIIKVNDQSYITIQDIKIMNSNFIGVRLEESGSNITVQRCYFYNSASGAFSASGSGLSYVTVDSCHFVHNQWRNQSSTTVPAACAITQGVHHSTIKNNYLTDSYYGENIGTYLNTHDNVVENNTIAGFYNVGIYISGCAYNTTVRNNLVYATTDTAGTNWVGISLVDEGWENCTGPYYLENNSVYNNVVVGCDMGIRLAPYNVSWSFAKDNKIYNNTLIDNLVNIQVDNPSARSPSGNSFQNNLSYCLTAGCVHFQCLYNCPSPVSYSGIDWDYNLWAGGTAPTGEASGAHDVTDTPTLIKTSGYRSIATGGLQLSDIKYSAITSAGVDDGATLGSPYNVDAFGISRPAGSGYDIGAHEWPATGTPTCGDTICDPATETCVSCEADCGACASGSFDCTDVSLIWDMEDKDVIQYTLGADTSFTLNSGAQINTDANKAGTANGLDCPTPNDNAQLTLADGLVVSRLEGSVAFWMRLYATPSNGATLWYAGASGSAIYITFITGGNVMLNIYNGSYVSLQTTGAGMTATGNPWYFVIARWKHSTNDRWVGVYNASGVLLGTAGENLTTAWTAPPSEFTSLYLGNTNSASTFDVHFDYLLGVSKKYDTDWLSIDTEAKPDCSGEDPVTLALTEIAVPVVPLSGQPTWTVHSTLAGTLTMTGPCKTDTTTISGGNNAIVFYAMGKGHYSNCVASVFDGVSTTENITVSPFTVDFWNLDFSPE